MHDTYVFCLFGPVATAWLFKDPLGRTNSVDSVGRLLLLVRNSWRNSPQLPRIAPRVFPPASVITVNFAVL